MRGNWILAAADESFDGFHAVVIAGGLAGRLEVPLTVVQVLGPNPTLHRNPSVVEAGAGGEDSAFLAQRRLRAWLESDARTKGLEPRPSIEVVYGIAGIEIARIGNARKPRLTVLGRRPRSAEQPRLLGDTADAVVRRSETPVLFVPASVASIRRVLVALDPSERSHGVLESAQRLARDFDAELSAVTVEAPRRQAEEDPELARSHLMAPRRTDPSTRAIARLSRQVHGAVRLEVRTGDPINQVLDCAAALRTDLLVIGYRRGGPPKVFGPAEIARNLLYAAPCGVLTIPL